MTPDTISPTTAVSDLPTLDFELPAALEATAPPEARGLARDGVRLMVSYHSSDAILHTTFTHLDHFLEAGDVVVINTSGTMNAALPATSADGSAYELHLSTQLPAGLWSVEVRRPTSQGTQPFGTAQPGQKFTLPAGGQVTLLTPYSASQRGGDQPVRLWVATLHLPQPLHDYLDQHGFPIRYGYVSEAWPLSYYQTVFQTERGSAEMPSAGRPFTPQLITKLVARGIQVLPIVLHTGVASLEDHEPPYEEVYRVPSETAAALNNARQQGRRIIAVGTTVVRALETVVDGNGRFHPGSGWTDVIVTPQRGVTAVDGLITGLHEPKATHLAMLAAIAGQSHLQHTYAQALALGYLWHEFGDLHLILP